MLLDYLLCCIQSNTRTLANNTVSSLIYSSNFEILRDAVFNTQQSEDFGACYSSVKLRPTFVPV